jgi:RimJ/RimL family protein N-acetyltransferase
VKSPFRGAELASNIAPTLQTDRLVLRHVRPSDIEYFAEAHGDEEVMRHLGGALGREDAWRRALTGAGFWGVLGIGVWVVERRSDVRTIGHVGFFDFQRDMSPSIAGEPEMGWIFSREGQGQGLASEAGRAALDWFDRSFGPMSVPAIIDLKNSPSMRLAERLGFERQPDGIYRGEAIAIYRRSARQLPATTASATSSAA